MKKLGKKIPASDRSRLRRKSRISYKVKGTAERPRLAVFRSNRAFYAQVINDDKGETLLAIASNAKENKGKFKMTKDGVLALGEALAKQAGTKNIKSVVFDRAGYLYHGRIKAFADGARKGGLSF